MSLNLPRFDPHQSQNVGLRFRQAPIFTGLCIEVQFDLPQLFPQIGQFISPSGCTSFGEKGTVGSQMSFAGGQEFVNNSEGAPNPHKKTSRILLGIGQVSVLGSLDLGRQKYIVQVLRQSQSFFRHLQFLPSRAVDILILRWYAAKNCN